MCTIHLFDGVNPDVKERHLDQIRKDWLMNSDGGSAMILDDHNEVTVRFQTTKMRHLLSMLKTSKGTTYIVHLRKSTTAAEGVSGCHMFDSHSGEWIYCHNGIISTREAYQYRVDSLALGDELDKESLIVPGMVELPDWSHHSFANVIAYHTISRQTFIHRSHHGQLHTDGDNWSSCRINHNYTDVQAGWYTVDGVPLMEYPKRVYTPFVGRRWNGSSEFIYTQGDNEWIDDALNAKEKQDSADKLLTNWADSEDNPIPGGLVVCDRCQSSVDDFEISLIGMELVCDQCIGKGESDAD